MGMMWSGAFFFPHGLPGGRFLDGLGFSEAGYIVFSLGVFWRKMVWKKNFLLTMVSFGVHVVFWGCTNLYAALYVFLNGPRATLPECNSKKNLKRKSEKDILLIEEILHHLGCIKPCK